MIYKNISISINGTQVVQINKRKAKKLYENGLEIFLHPCKMALQNMWQKPTEMSKKEFGEGCEFDRYLNSYHYYNCNSELGNYPVFFVSKDSLTQFNTKKP